MCFLTQYFRIFPAGSRTRLVCWACLVTSALWGTAFLIISAAPCFPLAAFFDWRIEATCYGYGSRNYNELLVIPTSYPLGEILRILTLSASRFATFVTHSSLNSLFDLIVLGIPLPMYLKKNTTSWKQRASIASMFGFGLLYGTPHQLFMVHALRVLTNYSSVFGVSIWRLQSIVEHRAATWPVMDPT